MLLGNKRHRTHMALPIPGVATKAGYEGAPGVPERVIRSSSIHIRADAIVHGGIGDVHKITNKTAHCSKLRS